MKTPKLPTGRWSTLRLIPLTVAALVALAGCGGGGGNPGVANPGPDPAPITGPDPIPQDVFNTYWNKCATPRTGVDASGKPFPDQQGTLLDELRFLRGWIDEDYLWYKEVPTTYRMADFTKPIDYFNVLKTTALTASGKPKDQFHFTYPTAEWEALTNSGIELGYGITWSSGSSTAPRNWLIATVEPGSPAAVAGLRRGDALRTLDGVDFVNASDAASIDRINAALFPERVGEAHRITVQRGGAIVDVSMNAAEVSASAVKNTKVIDTATGKVGYLTFESHNAVSEKQLIDSFTQFRNAGVSDLVLDVRYNGGGLLYIASELAYMIAGPTATAGKTFERAQYNDKTAPGAPIPFRSTAYGFAAPVPAPSGQALPYLNLKRVTVLTTPGTCSASEAVINGLRGIDIEVNIIGGQTCGKPYAFTPVQNCGTTYFAVEFQGVNNKGFGDYADGMAPTCAVADDLTREVGDVSEGLLAAALRYRDTGTCSASSMARAFTGEMTLVRPYAAEAAIHTRSR
ncbi:MAG TPA: S41 family peptidase [Telluria sp.]